MGLCAAVKTDQKLSLDAQKLLVLNEMIMDTAGLISAKSHKQEIARKTGYHLKR